MRRRPGQADPATEALKSAVRARDLDAMTAALEEGADPNFVKLPFGGFASLVAHGQFTEGARLLRARGMKPSKAGHAAWKGDRDTARALLPDKPGPAWTPYLALLDGEPVADWVAEHGGGGGDPKDRVPLLCWAIGVGRDEDVRGIAAAGGDVTWRKINGSTALAQLIGRRRLELVPDLFAAGADPNQKVEVRGRPPLFLRAVKTGSLATVRAFVEAGLNLNSKTLGATWVQQAAAEGQDEIAAWLRAQGAPER